MIRKRPALASLSLNDFWREDLPFVDLGAEEFDSLVQLQ
jgi:hypothetical protein